ncbi:thioesterase II family protein [Paenibacillus glacialis]|uniref:Thioesterase domain-containing protein n=1 Tax=Paenibacillus glacialis TaxID=494026 RepID=A0A168M7I3_9BACL|nr:thioesterase domain-containing protein [Paenibacillus glacialis]OAB44328.1 hypothetical protein PGLA_06610 [Paenibacillus glacialis]
MQIIKLFFIPYAGGSATVSLKWKEQLNPHIQLIPLELSGRGILGGEILHSNIHDAVKDLSIYIQNFLKPGERYAIYGHSLGSRIGFELVYELLANNYGELLHFFASGGSAPQIKRTPTYIYDKPDDEFKEHLMKYSQASNEVFENKELYDYFVPVLRADFQMSESYEYVPKLDKLSCNLTALTGLDDPNVSDWDMLEWGQHTTGVFKLCNVSGGHFFINENHREVVEIINNTLKSEILFDHIDYAEL